MRRSRKPFDSRCLFCGKSIDYLTTARTQTPPPKYSDVDVPTVGWVVCGEGCPGLPDEAFVYHTRRP